MNADPKSARQLFEQSLEQSKKLKSQEGVLQARSAIRRLNIKQYETPQHLSPGPSTNTESGAVPNE